MIYGQIALTFNKANDKAKALEYYLKCKKLSGEVSNTKLELDCLVKALDIRETLSATTGRPDLAPAYKEYSDALDVRTAP